MLGLWYDERLLACLDCDQGACPANPPPCEKHLAAECPFLLQLLDVYVGLGVFEGL